MENEFFGLITSEIHVKEPKALQKALKSSLRAEMYKMALLKTSTKQWKMKPILLSPNPGPFLVYIFKYIDFLSFLRLKVEKVLV